MQTTRPDVKKDLEKKDGNLQAENGQGELASEGKPENEKNNEEKSVEISKSPVMEAAGDNAEISNQKKVLSDESNKDIKHKEKNLLEVLEKNSHKSEGKNADNVVEPEINVQKRKVVKTRRLKRKKMMIYLEEEPEVNQIKVWKRKIPRMINSMMTRK